MSDGVATRISIGLATSSDSERMTKSLSGSATASTRRSGSMPSAKTSICLRNLGLAPSIAMAAAKSSCVAKASPSSSAVALATSRSWTRPSLVRISSSRSSFPARKRNARSAAAASSFPVSISRAVSARSNEGRSCRTAPSAPTLSIKPGQPSSKTEKRAKRDAIRRRDPIPAGQSEQASRDAGEACDQDRHRQPAPPDPRAGRRQQFCVAEPDAFAAAQPLIGDAHENDKGKPGDRADQVSRQFGRIEGPGDDEPRGKQRQRQEIRQHEVAPVDDRERQKHPSEEARRAKLPAARDDRSPQRDAERRDLDRRMKPPDCGIAIAATAAAREPRRDRHHVGRRERMPASVASRARCGDRQRLGVARDDDAEKAADKRRRHQRDHRRTRDHRSVPWFEAAWYLFDPPPNIYSRFGGKTLIPINYPP